MNPTPWQWTVAALAVLGLVLAVLAAALRRRRPAVVVPLGCVAVVVLATAGALTPAMLQLTASCRPGARVGYDLDPTWAPTVAPGGRAGLPVAQAPPADQTGC